VLIYQGADSSGEQLKDISVQVVTKQPKQGETSKEK